MKISIDWNDLLIEEGKLDPLGLWRVGDRLNGELLKPFTTIVLHRPARYFSMYCWIIQFLQENKIVDKNKYWERFYELESLLLCAIQLHHNHNYENFKGQIGSESAKTMIAAAINNTIRAEKINNGWDVNYKTPMFDFALYEVDFGSPGNLKLTEAGTKLAEAYKNSIEATSFYREYLSKREVPVNVIRELSESSCPCLLFTPSTDFLLQEREAIINSMLRVVEGNTEDKNKLLLSIYLILDCMISLDESGIPFNKIIWHRILSNQVYLTGAQFKNYDFPKRFEEIFKEWQLYNLDLLFVYSLENGLSGFLQYLQGLTTDLKFNELEPAAREMFKKGQLDCAQDNLIKMIPLAGNITSAYDYFNLQSSNLLYEFEARLVDKIQSASSGLRLFYSFLLYVYLQSKMNSKLKKADYKSSLEFYREGSERDGRELSLLNTLNDVSPVLNEKIEKGFTKIFLKKWIVDRQLETRITRGKDIAWFSRISETQTYSFEENYSTSLYRASRIDILLSFLLNIEIVREGDDSWVPNRSSSFFKA
ncbi:MAG TPA: hypothetical protein VLX29_08880 [Nitrospirota bacterium]|nr:hypothetical protein [Nitrospirota bacterium]